LGLDEEGKKEILGFWIHPQESSTLWGEILEEFKERGVEEVDLFITDNLRGIREAIQRAFPNSKWQPCWNHLSRNLQAKVRREDSLELAQDLRRVYKKLTPKLKLRGL